MTNQNSKFVLSYKTICNLTHRKEDKPFKIAKKATKNAKMIEA